MRSVLRERKNALTSDLPIGTTTLIAITPVNRSWSKSSGSSNLNHRRATLVSNPERYDKRAHEIHACWSSETEDGFQISEESMAWKAPKIIEVAVGLEINMYACASLKQ